MGDAAFDPAAIAADAVLLAELHGGTGRERVRIDWLRQRLAEAPGSKYVDGAGNLVWTFGPPLYRLAVLVHVDDVFDQSTPRGVTQGDGWLRGPGIGDNAIAVATAVAVCERVLPEPTPVAIVFTVGEEGLGGLRGARHACRELAPEAVLALEGHGSDRVFTTAVGSLRVRFSVTGPGGHSWWNRGRPSAVHELVRLLDGMIAAASAQLPVNVGLIEGGTGVNAIAARASAIVEWRATDQDLPDRQKAAVAGLEVSPRLRLSVRQLDQRPAGSIPLTHPLVDAVLRARRSIGLSATTADGSTDANAALAAGIPALALAAARARTCTPRPNGSAPTPSPPAPGNCAQSWRKSWSSPRAARGTDPLTENSSETEERKCCEPAGITSSRSATAGRCGSTVNRSTTLPRTRRSRRS